MPRPTRVEVDLDAIAHNVRHLRRLADPATICAVVKADAYGHGAVRVSQTVPGIGEEAFAVLRKGTVFGEMSVFDDAPRSADALAHERCELFSVEKEALHKLFAHNRLLACSVLGKMVRLMSRRLRQSNDKLAMLSVCAKFE